MQSINLKLCQLLTSQSQYVIPLYQRHYRWEEKQWQKLWEDIERATAEGRLHHFMGFLVVVQEPSLPGQPQIFQVIDGQQRLTTLSLFLIALRNWVVASEPALAEEITNEYLIHRYRQGHLRYRLLPRGQDQADYLGLVDSQSEIQNTMHRAVKFFSEKLDLATVEGTLETPRQLFDTVVQRLEFICATVDKTENPYNIFKALNSTGLPLSASDLVRNFMFMQVPPQEQEHFQLKYWQPLEKQFCDPEGKLQVQLFTDFLRDFLMSEGTFIPPKELFTAFEAQYDGRSLDYQSLVSELIDNAENYLIILGHKVAASEKLTNALAALRSLDVSTANPLLLKLLRLSRRGQMEETTMVRAMNLLVSFVLRRFVCNVPSKSYNKFFVAACKLIEIDGNLAALEASLHGFGFPGTEQFVNAFVHLPLYGSRYTRFILEALERSFAHKEMANLSQAQIEHIMPQTLTRHWQEALGADWERIHSTWLHTPGNLTLSGYNSELSNRPFSEKRAEYERSNIVLTRALSTIENWDEQQILKRGEQLGRQAAELWPLPHVSQCLSNKEHLVHFWSQFWEHLKVEGSFLYHPERKPRLTQQWLWFGVGKTGYSLFAWVDLQSGYLAVFLSIDNQRNREHFEKLLAQQATIEEALGKSLDWAGEIKAGEYVVRITGNFNLQNRSEWNVACEWLREHLETFHSVFKPRIKAL
jgi:uncharacterized protein with ParB-like and HNH nuclease domain